jgi:hypothetical protein
MTKLSPYPRKDEDWKTRRSDFDLCVIKRTNMDLCAVSMRGQVKKHVYNTDSVVVGEDASFEEEVDAVMSAVDMKLE